MPPEQDTPEDEVDDTIAGFGQKRVVVLTYCPTIDEVEIDFTGCSPLELRGIIADAFSRLFPSAVEMD